MNEPVKVIAFASDKKTISCIDKQKDSKSIIFILYQA